MATASERVLHIENWGMSGGPGSNGKRLRDPHFAIVRQESRRSLGALARAIETEIVPRLVLARGTGRDRTPEPTAPATIETLAAASIARYVALTLAGDEAAAAAHITALQQGGASVETLYLDLLAPSARRLGEMWEQDECGFGEVTLGLLHLHRALRLLGPAFANESEHRQRGRRALLMPAPGDQHSFGLAMVTAFFRRAGWQVWSSPPESLADQVALVHSEWFAVVGFSLGCGGEVDRLARAIQAVRRGSRNRGIGVMVGGPVFVLQPGLAGLIGADATATDGRQAVRQAENLLGLLAHPG